jgi:hypothetical protein
MEESASDASKDSKGYDRFPLLTILFLMTLAVIGSNFYKYYYSKNFDYLIESPCDPASEICFERDCTNPDDCPPNGLAVYKQYYVKAYDFPKCSDNSCLRECTEGIIACHDIPCDQDGGDSCLVYPSEE